MSEGPRNPRIAGYELQLADVVDAFDVDHRDVLPDLTREGDPRYAAHTKESYVVWSRCRKGLGPEDFVDPEYAPRTRGVDWSYGVGILAGSVQTATATSMAANPTVFFQATAGGSALVGAGARLYKSTSGTAWGAAALVAGNAITDIDEVNGTWVICTGPTGDYYYSTDLVTFAQPTGTTYTKAKFGLVSTTPGGVPVIAFVLANGSIWHTNNPGVTVPSPSGVTSVGTTAGTATGAALYNGLIAIVKDNGVYLVNVHTGVVRPILEGPEAGIDPDTAAICEWNGALFFRRNAALYRFQGDMDGGTLDKMGPDWQQERTSQAFGLPTALLPTERWLWALFKSEGTARYEVLVYDGDEPDGRPRWFTKLDLGTTDACQALGWFVPTATSSDPLLLLGKGAAVGYVIQPSPQAGHHPLNSTTYQYTTTGSANLTRRYWGFAPYLDKHGLAMWPFVASIDNAAGRSVTVRYTRDNGTEQSLGNVQANGTPLYFPATPTNSSDFQEIQLDLTLTTDAATSTPIVRALTFEHWTEQPSQEVHTLKLAINPTLQGVGTLAPSKVWSQLKAWQKQGAPLSYVDPDGDQHYADLVTLRKSSKGIPKGTKPGYYMLAVLEPARRISGGDGHRLDSTFILDSSRLD